MRLVSVESIKDEATLAKPIFNDKGQILLGEGVTLTERMIMRLKEMGITLVYIEDRFTSDVQVNPPITPQTKAKALGAIDHAFDIVKKGGDIEKAFVFEKVGQKFVSIVRDILAEIQSNKEAISLLSEVYTHDNYIFSHSLNVTIYTLALANQMKFSEKQLHEIGLGAMLHDVGKMMIPLEILAKPGKLTKEEYEIIKNHSEYGFQILRKMDNIPLLAAHCAYQHHERLDGTGYPRSLKGDEIHYYSRLIAVADVYDAVTSNRVYRRAMLPHEGLEILYAGAGTQFQLDLVDAFRRAIAVYPIGLTVYLNDGRKGVVIKQNEGLSERPVIRIFGKDIKPYEVDLSKELTIIIKETDTTLNGNEMNQ